MKKKYFIIPFFVSSIHLLTSQSWHTLGSGLNGAVNTIVIHNQEVYVGGGFINAGGDPQADFIAKWDGSSWKHVAPGLLGSVAAIAFMDNDIYIGGSFPNIDTITNTKSIARWDGYEWHALGQGLNKFVTAIAIRNDMVFVGGAFTEAGGIDSADHIAFWKDDNWHALGSGIVPLNNGVWSIGQTEDDIYVGGDFFTAGGIPDTRCVARWDGSQWHSLGGGFWGDMGAITISINGDDIYVGGDGGSIDTASCGIAKWDGHKWNPVGSGLSNCIYSEGAYTITSNGNSTFVGGFFVNAGGVSNTECLAKWDGSNWSALGIPGLAYDPFHPEAVNAIASDGVDIYVGGNFPDIAGVSGTMNIARWEESTVSVDHDLPVGISDFIRVHPNPSHDFIQIHHEEEALESCSLTILNATGRVVLKAYPTLDEINIGDLPAGMYYLKAETRNGQQVARFVKN